MGIAMSSLLFQEKNHNSGTQAECIIGTSLLNMLIQVYSRVFEYDRGTPKYTTPQLHTLR